MSSYRLYKVVTFIVAKDLIKLIRGLEFSTHERTLGIIIIIRNKCE